ncbi:hypothetical protein C8R43DRAFT_1028059 [Mycena crocata]|nr:hypothetical protein C8R43DRAFT_1028059 [Mycena crocata]
MVRVSASSQLFAGLAERRGMCSKIVPHRTLSALLRWARMRRVNGPCSCIHTSSSLRSLFIYFSLFYAIVPTCYLTRTMNLAALTSSQIRSLPPPSFASYHAYEPLVIHDKYEKLPVRRRRAHSHPVHAADKMLRLRRGGANIHASPHPLNSPTPYRATTSPTAPRARPSLRPLNTLPLRAPKIQIYIHVSRIMLRCTCMR